MAYLAIRGSGAVNGVSRLHGNVSRHLFAPLFPHWPVDDVPIGHVTNGVHMPSWDSAAADELWTAACGKERWRGMTEYAGAGIRHVSDAQLWQLRNDGPQSRSSAYARDRLSQQLTTSGGMPEAVTGQHICLTQALTLGLCAALRDLQATKSAAARHGRLLRMLTNPRGPCNSSCGQSPSRRPSRTDTDSGMDPIYSAA